MERRSTPHRGARAVAVGAMLGLAVIAGGWPTVASHALAASRSHSMALAPKPTATSASASNNSRTQPGPGAAAGPTPVLPFTGSSSPSSGLPTTGGASGQPGTPSEPAWPIALLGLLVAAAGVSLRRATRK